MATKKAESVSNILRKPKKKRAGIHSKKKSSKSKKAKNYKKAYVGQGK